MQVQRRCRGRSSAPPEGQQGQAPQPHRQHVPRVPHGPGQVERASLSPKTGRTPGGRGRRGETAPPAAGGPATAGRSGSTASAPPARKSAPCQAGRRQPVKGTRRKRFSRYSPAMRTPEAAYRRRSDRSISEEGEDQQGHDDGQNDPEKADAAVSFSRGRQRHGAGLGQQGVLCLSRILHDPQGGEQIPAQMSGKILGGAVCQVPPQQVSR